VTKKPVNKVRRTQEQRRTETQEAILSAALHVLSEDGFSKFSASRVAARAEVSRGALEHYLPTKNDLLVAATQYAMDHAVAHAKVLAGRANKSEDPIRKFMLDSEHFFFSPGYRAMLELAMAANGEPELSRPFQPIVVKARESLNQIWLDTLEKAGYPHQKAQDFVELTHHLFRGVFLAKTWLPYNTDWRAMMKIWSALAPAILGPTILGPQKAAPARQNGRVADKAANKAVKRRAAGSVPG
jgi:AcrR family transcriptional regulator